MSKPIPFGKYYLLDRINVGGMAEVFKAKAFGVEGFERVVAVKKVLPSIAEDKAFAEMLVDEARLAVQLSHANIAEIFDLGQVGESYFIALEYVDGVDLRVIFEMARRKRQPLPPGIVSYLFGEVCEGLHYAHDKRDAEGRPLELVHRDVSPQNILVSHDGEVKLIDFGIAKAVGKAGKTQSGMLKGKFGYLSPEQAEGASLDRRSDLFSAGICMHELLTASRLFGAATDFESLQKARLADVEAPSVSNPELPEGLDAVVLKALARDPDERFQTARELADALTPLAVEGDSEVGRRELADWMAVNIPRSADDTVVTSSTPGFGERPVAGEADDPDTHPDPGADSKMDSAEEPLPDTPVAPIAIPTEAEAGVGAASVGMAGVASADEGSADLEKECGDDAGPTPKATDGEPLESADTSGVVSGDAATEESTASRTGEAPGEDETIHGEGSGPLAAADGGAKSVSERLEGNQMEQNLSADNNAALADMGQGPDSEKPRPKNPKATILGMPAVLPGSAPSARLGRSVPPPPPRSVAPPAPGAVGAGVPATVSDSAPPPSPSAPPPPIGSVRPSVPPPPMPGASISARPSVPPPPSASAPPSPSASAPPPPPGASVPPPPPGASAPPPPMTAETSTPPATTSPVLDMDWDDEDLSTQIYDRPEDLENALEAHENPPVSARSIPTYVPPMPGEGAAPGYGGGTLAGTAPMFSPGTPAAPGAASLAATPLPGFAPTASSPELVVPGSGPVMDPTQSLPPATGSSNKARDIGIVAGIAALVALVAIFVIGGSGDPGIITVTTVPMDAEVLFNGEPIGTSSPFFKSNVEPDTEHTLMVRKEGFKSWSQKVELVSGQKIDFPVQLQQLSINRASAAPAIAGANVNTGFKLETDPAGASVYLDGQLLNGLTPFAVTDIAPGRHALRVEKRGFIGSSTRQINLFAGQVLELDSISLQAQLASVSFSSRPRGAQVTLVRGNERRALGTTPLTAQVDATGGDWKVEMALAGHGKATGPVLVDQDGQGKVELALAPLARRAERPGRARASTPRRTSRAAPRVAARPAPVRGTGTLRVNSSPWSKVWVDGRAYGNTPQMNIKLSAGRHKIRLENPDFKLRKTVTVDVKAGETVTKIIKLAP